MTAHRITVNDAATPAQNRMMHALWRQHGIHDRSDRLRITGVMVNRDVESSRELTRHEATRLIDQLMTEGPQDLW